MDALCGELGIRRVTIAHRNVGHHRHYAEYCNHGLRRSVGHMFAEEIEYVGYEFAEEPSKTSASCYALAT